MFTEILNVIAPVLTCILVGYVWRKTGQVYPSEFVSKLVFNVGAPCLVVSSLSQVSLSMQALWQVGMATVMAFTLLLLLGFVLVRSLNHDRTFVVSLAFPNVGNMGLPIIWFAFGEQGLALAVAYFMVISIAHFSLGVAIASGEAISWRHFFANPILWAIFIAIFLVFYQWSLPSWLDNSVGLIAQLTIPLMLITLGVSLANIQLQQWRKGLLYSLLRIGLGGLVALVVVYCLDLQGTLKAVVILMGIMPVAVFNYLFALNSGRETQAVASLVFISTLLAVLVLPLVLYFLL